MKVFFFFFCFFFVVVVVGCCHPPPAGNFVRYGTVSVDRDASMTVRHNVLRLKSGNTRASKWTDYWQASKWFRMVRLVLLHSLVRSLFCSLRLTHTVAPTPAASKRVACTTFVAAGSDSCDNHVLSLGRVESLHALIVSVCLSVRHNRKAFI